jgi:phosphatidylglycerol:prolipoprotein diacylglycerol transferase
VVKIWQGGLAIHGALLGGLLALLLYARFKRINSWNLIAVVLPGLALAQAIGRWGNWVNQELFGLPSTLPWSIPIDFAHRPRLYEAITYFHPTFLYESIAMLFVFGILYYLATKKTAPRFIIGTYLIAYGLVRFLLEFIKIDTTPIVLGLRWPQLVSLVMIAGAITMFTIKKVKP